MTMMVTKNKHEWSERRVTHLDVLCEDRCCDLSKGRVACSDDVVRERWILRHGCLPRPSPKQTASKRSKP